MKKVVRITGTQNLMANEPRFKQEAKEIGGIDIDFINYFDLYHDNGFKNINTGEFINEYDIRRIGGLRGKSMRDGIIYKYGHLLNKKIVDESKKYMISNDKFIQTIFLEHLGYPHPKSIFFITKEKNTIKQINILENKFIYPFIAKEVDKDQGKGVHLIKNQKSLKNLLNQHPEKGFLFQEYIENEGDYRILVVGDKTLGAIKRYNPEDFKNNISTGGTTKSVELPEKIHQTAINIAKNFQLQIAGIDFFIKNNNYYVIEINELPQYKGFEEGTGISYPKEALKYFKIL